MFKRNSKNFAGKPQEVTDLFDHFAEIKEEYPMFTDYLKSIYSFVFRQ